MNLVAARAFLLTDRRPTRWRDARPAGRHAAVRGFWRLVFFG